MLKWFRGRPGCVTGWEVQNDPGVAANLKSLGYIGTDQERTDVILGAEPCADER